MSDRGAIVSQYVYCHGCEEAIRGSSLDFVRHPTFPIYTAHARGIGNAELWGNTLAALDEMRPCHALRFAVLDDNDAGALLTVSPAGGVSLGRTAGYADLMLGEEEE